MNLSKFKVQKVELLKRNQPELYDDLKRVVPHLNDEDLGKVAGLIIEYVIQSGGNVEIFNSEDIEDIYEEDI